MPTDPNPLFPLVDRKKLGSYPMSVNIKSITINRKVQLSIAFSLAWKIMLRTVWLVLEFSFFACLWIEQLSYVLNQKYNESTDEAIYPISTPDNLNAHFKCIFAYLSKRSVYTSSSLYILLHLLRDSTFIFVQAFCCADGSWFMGKGKKVLSVFLATYLFIYLVDI